MGSGIAQVSALGGYNVTLQDISGDSLERARTGISASVAKFVSKGKVSQEEADLAIGRIQYATDLTKAVAQADLIIEAVFENLVVKQELFRKLEETAKPNAILASNTSALPITEIASGNSRAANIVGIHFMNPVPLMKGVEVIRGQLTTDDVYAQVITYLEKINKEPIEAVDYAGFIVSRLLDVLMNEAVKLVQEGFSPESIDKAMVLCAGHPMGPCKLLDLVGAEIAMHGMETMARDFGESYKPHPLLKKRVLAGLLGKKTGQGFYSYE